jgi:hypothetical protein
MFIFSDLRKWRDFLTNYFCLRHVCKYNNTDAQNFWNFSVFTHTRLKSAGQFLFRVDVYMRLATFNVNSVRFLMRSQQNSLTLNSELNPICHLLELLGAHHILHVSRIRVKVTEIYGTWSYHSVIFHTPNLEHSFRSINVIFLQRSYQIFPIIPVGRTLLL